MVRLEVFVGKIEKFDEISPSNRIDMFAYFLLVENKIDGIVAKNIAKCFDELHLVPYSNISAYLAAKAKGKDKKFIRKNGGKYYLERSFKDVLENKLGVPALPAKVQSDFFPIELFDNTRGYLIALANQTLASFNNGIYDGCSVLSRKIVEILIIECFEKHKCENLIKKPDGAFFYLSDLIGEFLKEPKWNVGRNAKNGLPKIKKIGDQSAHNRRYIARKNDLEHIKEELRVVIEELVHLIDYPTWKS
ncbi:hypothetical protein [Paraflavitalea sp. CAU 1676]|uniref:hypothetical protein n=1 Tax=Paraflavitalea sp. CAU 1676 TaxID=3032598 RepID=UPI0023DCBF27|nr:hypothetical protein [Paraflavitalea sp. CAU 1676]MDF2189836.1 hypothetical protein [Paraflavitalea sp. CAU 1676]